MLAKAQRDRIIVQLFGRNDPLDQVSELRQCFALLVFIGITVIDALHAGNGMAQNAFANIGANARA